jgi:ZIP family zinc transporter
VAAALFWGVAAAASLLIGAGVALLRPPNTKVLGTVMSFGAGVLLSAVAFELVAKGINTEGALQSTALGLFAGATVFTLGDRVIDHFGYGERKDIGGAPPEGSGLAIVLGAMLDGIPESAVLGLTLLQTGEIGVSMLVAVFVSNFPEGMAATTGLHNGGWTTGRIVALWSAVMVASGIAAALGFTLLDGASPSVISFMLGFSGGAILTMLATSMMPEAYEHAGRLVGIANVLGFAVAVWINWLEVT